MTYRPPRPGDLITVHAAGRVVYHAVIDGVRDDGQRLTYRAAFGDRFFDVTIRRLGLTLQESPVQIISDIVDAFDAVKEKLDPVVHTEFDALKTAVETRFATVEADLKAALEKLAALEKAAAPAVEAAATDAEHAVEQVAADAVKGA